MNKIKDQRPLDSTTHSVRRSQAVLQYGVGAMIDFPSQVLMTGLPEAWNQPEIIHDERLEKLLGVQHFITPSDAGIPFVRFPRWYFCPKCRRFKPIEEWQKEHFAKSQRKGNTEDTYMLRRLRCSEDGQALVPARIVSVCEHGHIDDFPWVNWVHRQNKYGGEKDVCLFPKLKFKTGTSATSGLEGVEVECESCGAKASLFGAFNTDKEGGIFKQLETTSKFHTSFSCTGRHPWKNEREFCGAYPRAMQRGASSVYFPRVISSLVIPPYSSYLTSKVEESDTYKKLFNVIEDGIDECDSEKEQVDFINKKIEKYVDVLAEEIYESVEAVKAVLKRKLLPVQENNGDVDKELVYKAEEYKALTGKITSENFEKDEFKREGVDIALYRIKGIKSILFQMLSC